MPVNQIGQLDRQSHLGVEACAKVRVLFSKVASSWHLFQLPTIDYARIRSIEISVNNSEYELLNPLYNVQHRMFVQPNSRGGALNPYQYIRT